MSNGRDSLIHQRNCHLKEHLEKNISLHKWAICFFLKFATQFASKGEVAGLKMMDCSKWAATEIL